MKLDSNLEAQLRTRDFSQFLADLPSRNKITNWLEGQNLSADAKILVLKLVDTSIEVGGQIISIGRKILSTVAWLLKQYPNTSFGLVIGAVMSFLIGSIPLFGWILGPLLSPILLAFGIGMGAVADFQVIKLKARYGSIEEEYAVLKV